MRGVPADFGSPYGMAIVALNDVILTLERRTTEPYYSQVSDRTYGYFDREHFIDALNDWGWFGKGDPPDWYAGAAWSE